MVITRRRLGKMENSRTLFVKSVRMRIIMEMAKFTVSRRSRRKEGIGRMMMAMTPTTAKAMRTSAYFLKL